MQVYEQGEDYQEDEYEEDLEDESSEDTEAKVTSFYGIPIKTVAIVGAVVLVIVLAMVLFATRRKKSSEDIDAQLQQALQENSYDDTYADAGDYSQTETPTAVDTGASGDMVYNPDTGLWEATGGSEDSTPTTVESATEEERLTLRAMGYSGDEIDYCLANGFSVQALVDAALELYDEEAKKALERMSDTASPEFKYLIDNTYFSQTGYVFESVADKEFGTYDYSTGSYTVNADYVKCPTYGAQLYLKCRVAQDLWLWYVVTPERWAKLPDEGNIVLRVNYTQYGVNTYVTGISETDPTLDTIDSSASAIGDIVDSEHNSGTVENSEQQDLGTGEQTAEGADSGVTDAE